MEEEKACEYCIHWGVKDYICGWTERHDPFCFLHDIKWPERVCEDFDV